MCAALRIQTPTTGSFVILGTDDAAIGPYSTSPVVKTSPLHAGNEPLSSIESLNSPPGLAQGPPVPPRNQPSEYMDLSDLSHYEEPHYEDPKAIKKQKPPIPPRPHVLASRKESHYTLPRPAPDGQDSPELKRGKILLFRRLSLSNIQATSFLDTLLQL